MYHATAVQQPTVGTVNDLIVASVPIAVVVVVNAIVVVIVVLCSTIVVVVVVVVVSNKIKVHVCRIVCEGFEHLFIVMLLLLLLLKLKMLQVIEHRFLINFFIF